MLENRVEAESNRQAKRRGVWAIKLRWMGGRGWPDHTLFAPGGKVAFLELKKPKGSKDEALQPWVQRKLRRLGFRVAKAYTQEEVKAFYNEWLGEVN